MSIDTTKCIAQVNGNIEATSGEAAKRQSAVRLWRSGRYDSVEALAAVLYSGKVADANLPDHDPLTGDETQAKRQRDRFASFCRRVASWVGA